ncbi:MAG: GNAT family N-acetyltransferase [Akkermansiaceae bacterium]|nr:GNAT family N-acetyltransferase [Armatimonadota bacterium]
MFALRVAVPSDAEELSRLATETFHDGWASIIGEEFANAYAAEHLRSERLGAEIEEGDTHHFALATNAETGAIIGYGKLGLKRPAHESVLGPRPVVLQRFYVAAAGRGTGVADALLSACEQEATRLLFATLWLECDPRNERAWRFYERRGFIARGVSIYHYPNGFNDKIRIMERPITGGERTTSAPFAYPHKSPQDQNKAS